MLYAIMTSFTVGLLYLVSLTVTIQVIRICLGCHDSTQHPVLCILRLTLCQGVCFWCQMGGQAFGMRIRPKLHGMQSDSLSLFVKLRSVHYHVMYA